MAINKIERYGWTLKDSPGELMIINKNNLFVNNEYQRDQIKDKLKIMAASWSWIACGAITVAKRDEKFWVMDGQHRVLAAQRRDDIEGLPCIVFETRDIKEEASGFLNANTLRRSPSIHSRFKALVVAQDETAIFVKQCLDRFDIEVCEWKKQNKNKVQCISSFLKLAAIDKNKFLFILSIVVDLAFKNNLSISEILFEGIKYIHNRFDLQNNKTLLNRIQKIGAETLVDNAKKAAAYYTKGGDKVWATGMLNIINKGLAEKNKFKIGG